MGTPDREGKNALAGRQPVIITGRIMGHITMRGLQITAYDYNQQSLGDCDSYRDAQLKVRIAAIGEALAHAVPGPGEAINLYGRWELRDMTTDALVEPGSQVTTFRGETVTVTGYEPPYKATADGRVTIDDNHSVYASVVNARWVLKEATQWHWSV
jgi:hypothetical protein